MTLINLLVACLSIGEKYVFTLSSKSEGKKTIEFEHSIYTPSVALPKIVEHDGEMYPSVDQVRNPSPGKHSRLSLFHTYLNKPEGVVEEDTIYLHLYFRPSHQGKYESNKINTAIIFDTGAGYWYGSSGKFMIKNNMLVKLDGQFKIASDINFYYSFDIEEKVKVVFKR